MDYPRLTRRRTLQLTALGLASTTLATKAFGMAPAKKPLVIGHRGASALRPEHTLGSYAKAIADGADFIEPDLVSTRDGHLVARHENNIAETTDVSTHPEFAARKTQKTVDGAQITGWFTEDFTLAELKTLRARERLGAMRPISQGYDGTFQIVTIEEIADFVAAESAARGRPIGIIPEFKHPSYFAALGLACEDRFLSILAKSRYLSTAPLILQSFETANLKALRPKIAGHANIQLMQLIGAPKEHPFDRPGLPYAAMMAPAGLAEIASYADYISPELRAVIPLGPDGKLAAPSGLAEAAHKAGLKVSVYTFRPENYFLAADFRNGDKPNMRNEAGSVAEIKRYLGAGLDAFFTDDPALGRQAVEEFVEGK